MKHASSIKTWDVLSPVYSRDASEMDKAVEPMYRVRFRKCAEVQAASSHEAISEARKLNFAHWFPTPVIALTNTTPKEHLL